MGMSPSSGCAPDPAGNKDSGSHVREGHRQSGQVRTKLNNLAFSEGNEGSSRKNSKGVRATWSFVLDSARKWIKIKR
jgi:hypothetical protein